MTSREIADKTRAILVSMSCKKDCHEESSISQLVNQGRQGWDAGASIARIRGSAWIMHWPEYICVQSTVSNSDVGLQLQNCSALN